MLRRVAQGAEELEVRRRALRLGLAVAEDDLAVGRPGRVAHPLELEGREDVGQPAVAVLRNPLAIEHVPAGGDDDIADLQLDDFVLCSKSMAPVGQSFSQARHF